MKRFTTVSLVMLLFTLVSCTSKGQVMDGPDMENRYQQIPQDNDHIVVDAEVVGRTSMKYIYLVNRFQLKKKTALMIERLLRVSRKMKRDFEILINESPEQAGSAVRRYRNPGNIITAVGGDGAINHVLNDLAGTDTILSFLPAGTGNDFFRTCKETIPGGIQNVDMIRINDRYFINTACFGIDADIANDGHFIHNRFIPRPLRYHFSVLFHFFTYGKGRHLKVLYDGNEIENDFLTIVAANGRYYGGGYKVSPGSLLDDGLMEVYLVDSMPKIRMAAMILSMKHAGHLKNPAVHMIRTKELQIISDRPINASIDGEAMQSDHFDLKLNPKGIALEFNPEFITVWREYPRFCYEVTFVKK